MIGRGEPTWSRAAADVLRWRIKTASGFRVEPEGSAAEGDRVQVSFRLLGLSVVEPVVVVEVVRLPDRVGFAYGTLPGHPVAGEEAFIVHRDGDEVRLTVRSLTIPAPQQPWRMMFPALLLAQRFAHARYLRALR